MSRTWRATFSWLRTTLRSSDGGIGLLGLGLCVCVAMLIVGGVSVSTAQMARVDVLDAADHASAAAADQIALAQVYAAGVEHTALDPAEVSREAARILASAPRPPHVDSWTVTGVEINGQRLDLRVRAVVRPPVIGSAMRALGAPMTVDVVSHADAHLQR